MPLHDFRCPDGHVTEEFVEHGVDRIVCQKCGQCSPECAAKHIPGYDVIHPKMWAYRVFLRAPMSFVRKDVHYTSPVDGRPITSHQQHLEDLARSDCVLYESGIKQDQERNERLRDEALERSVDETVDREIALLPAVKREKLIAELEGGLTAEPQRGTVPAKPIVTEIQV